MTPEYIAAIYLLTSYEYLWEKAKVDITTSKIDFGKMDETTLTLILNALRIKRTGYKDRLTAEKLEYAQK